MNIGDTAPENMEVLVYMKNPGMDIGDTAQENMEILVCIWKIQEWILEAQLRRTWKY